MSDENDFVAALDNALALGAEHEAALQLVASLTRSLEKAVLQKTSGLVSVILIVKAEMPTLGIGQMFGFTSQPKIGKDKEDKQVEQFVVAVSTAGEQRALWEVQFNDTGYPVILRGPVPDAVVACFSEQDVRRGFLEAAASGIVGRKLSALAAHASAVRQSKGEPAALGATKDATGTDPTVGAFRPAEPENGQSGSGLAETDEGEPQ